MVRAYGCIDIIVRRDSLESKEKGLSQKLIDAYEIPLEFYDDKIICIPGGMNPYDVENEVRLIEDTYGLVFNPDINKAPSTDIVIIEGLLGIRTDNNWLKETSRNEDGIAGRKYYFEEK